MNLWTCEVWARSGLDDTEVLLSPGDSLIDEMKAWTTEQGGKQNMWNQFQFGSKEDATMFVLRWSNS